MTFRGSGCQQVRHLMWPFLARRESSLGLTGGSAPWRVLQAPWLQALFGLKLPCALRMRAFLPSPCGTAVFLVPSRRQRAAEVPPDLAQEACVS